MNRLPEGGRQRGEPADVGEEDAHRVVLLDEELLEGLSRLVELVLLDVAPDAVADLRRYVLRDDGEQQVLL